MMPFDDGSQPVFGTSGQDRFDSIADPQKSMPHMMEYLWDQYRASLSREIDKRKANGQSSVSIQEAAKIAPATHFVDFCTDFLAEQYVVETFPVDRNFGLRLVNNDCLTLSVGSEVEPGSMEESTSIPVTTGIPKRHERRVR